MSRKITDEEIGKAIKKALDKLEIANDIIKSYIDYCDVNEEELTESQRIYLRRCKEFLGVK
tara:strand:+ start:402 stop:584 length:183 start_codon:yes stop_codon:yes gene_type:complete